MNKIHELAVQGKSIQDIAITLGIGVVMSLISAIVVTHNLLSVVLNFGGVFREPGLLGVQRGRA